MTRPTHPRDIDLDTPLRLSVAAAFAFPDGSMSAAGLRREHARGRLVIERIAGRDYTTMRAIQEMRRQCHVHRTRLYRRRRRGREVVWVIRDGEHEESTGCPEHDIEGAEAGSKSISRESEGALAQVVRLRF